MRIESITLENFGIYGSKLFRFDGQPLVLIYGPNESGKTTTLDGLRQALFGFPRQSAYITGKTMSAEGHVTLADGRQIRFVRQKKNNDGFKALTDGKIPLSETQWQQLCSGLDLKAYQSLFGFSLEELRSGEKALVHAPIEQALSSSGFGGLAQLQKVQNRIDAFLSDSLKRAGTGGAINAKLAEIEAAERHLESVLTLPADVTALRTQLVEAQSHIQDQQTQLQRLREQLTSGQRQQAALPAWVQYTQVQTSLGQYDLPATLDNEFRVQWTVLCNRLAGLNTELLQETARLTAYQSELTSLPTTTGAQTHQAEALALGKQARQVPAWRQQLTDTQRELDELDRELGDALRKLGLSLQDSRWRTLSLDLSQQADLEAARQSLDQLSGELNQCITRLDVADKQLQMHRPPAASTNEGCAGPSLDQLLELETQLRCLRPQALEVDQLRKEHSRLRGQLQLDPLLQRLTELSERLNGHAEPIDLSPEWQLPAPAQLQQLQRQLADAVREWSRLKLAIEKNSQQQSALQSEITQSQTQAGLKSLAELEALWCQRDQIVEHWRDELRTPLLASTASPTEYEERLSQLERLHNQSDAAVRNMLAAVDQVAKLAAKERQLNELQQSWQGLQTEQQAAMQSCQETIATWQKLLSVCEVTRAWSMQLSTSTSQLHQAPARCQLVAEWSELYTQWSHARRTLDKKESEVTVAEQQYAQARTAFCELWPEIEKCTSLAQAEQMIGRMRSTLAARDAQARLLATIEQTYSASLNQRQVIEARLDAQRVALKQSLAAVGLPESWPPSELNARLESVRRCQKLATKQESVKARLSSLQKQLHQFSDQVSQLGRKLGIELTNQSGMMPEEYATMWMDQFVNRERADQRRSELATLLADQQAQCARRTTQIQQLRQQQSDLVAQLSGESVEQVQRWVEQSATVFQLRSRQAELQAALQSAAAGKPLEQFLSELAQLDPRSVTAMVAGLTAQVGSLEANLNLAQQAVGGLARELEFKEKGSAALEAEQHLKRLRAELVELSEQWVVHRLAGELLVRTIDRFTRDHEPHLIKHTRRFFRELTDDRYCMVMHDSGKHGGFAVRDQHGHTWQPDKLSTGTREQLYLAIRLAFVTHFNETHEPLPVIMDDCFVNFDDIRARIALRTLINWQESVQTILLSCHLRSIEALAELAPDTPVLDIASGHMAPAKEMWQSHALAPSRSLE